MALFYFLKQALVSTALVGSPSTVPLPALPPDSLRTTAPLLLKVGLRLTHLHYAHDSQAWQFLLPLSLGAEYRVAPRLSLYGQAEADLLTASQATGRRRVRQQSALSGAAINLGLRYYYGQPKTTGSRTPSPEFGKYLALDGGADWQQLTTTGGVGRRQRTMPASLTPAMYALWGIQNRLLPHVLYDLNAGVGLLAPVHYYNFERISGTTHWNAGAQVNIRVYLVSR
ncbi:hypothetical protein GO988_18540 [Hymenobacter sp. HMF4947]|uniref:DUF3575 domain-containing protein n=1 Tax=Hymenobacter ginkgonis TaxID=2682976 RepID=A0A7K1TIY8_9BACT|nr:hypothetical protein [Hymenobacter ginkgonis]MVN78333.1 hypothetical protein [Hymenobacter ginkgonis]